MPANPSIVFKTRVLCMDTAMHPRHQVRAIACEAEPSGYRYECDCGAEAVEEGKRLGTLVSLGTPNVLRRSCTGLVAFLAVGIPSLVRQRVDKTGAWGGWKDAWISYQTNALVRQVFSELVFTRDAAMQETYAVATKALLACARYRNGMSKADFRQEISWLDNTEPKVGDSVALFSSDRWTVPLQKDWLENVGKAKPVIDGKFIVGIVHDKPGFVLAIDGADEDGFVVEEFAVVNGKLGKIARAA